MEIAEGKPATSSRAPQRVASRPTPPAPTRRTARSTPGDGTRISQESRGSAPAAPRFLSALERNFAFPKTEPAPVATSARKPAPRIDQLPPRIDAPTQIVGRPESPDPSRRNVIVLDDFRTADNPIRGTTPRSHGEAISRPLETQGYNVYRVQDSELDEKGKNTSERNTLDHLAERIQKGEIPARAGDVVNLSFGQDEKLTIQDVNRMAGYRGDQQLSRDSLNAERVQQLRETLQMRLDDPKSGMSSADRERVTDILATAAGVDKLKSMGLVVINAGGNEGPDGLHPGFLNSTHSLQNRNGDGSFDPTSARHGLTEPARGSFVSRPVGGGVDVNNDGIPDFEHRPNGAEQLSGTSFSVLEFLRRKYPASLN